MTPLRKGWGTQDLGLTLKGGPPASSVPQTTRWTTHLIRNKPHRTNYLFDFPFLPRCVCFNRNNVRRKYHEVLTTKPPLPISQTLPYIGSCLAPKNSVDDLA